MAAQNPRAVLFGGFGDNYPNYAAAANGLGLVAADAGAPVAAGMPATNLQTEEPSEVCRITTLDPLYTYFKNFPARVLSQFPTSIDLVALINANLSPWGYWRISSTSPATQIHVAAPNATAGTSNITGTHTDINEAISSPNANYVTPTTHGTGWHARFSFASLAGTMKTGTARAQFVLRARFSGSTGFFYPDLNVQLYENGVFVQNLGFRYVTDTSANGQILIFSFDPAVLSDLTGANIECYVAGSPTPAPAYIELNTLALYYEIAAPNVDSGYLASPFSTTLDPNLSGPSKHLHHIFDTAKAFGPALYVSILDDQANHISAPPLGVLSTPDGYVQAGVLVTGPALFIENGLQGAPQTGVIIEGSSGNTGGGQTYAADLFRRRSLSIVPIVTEDEKVILEEGVDWRRGMAGAFFVASMANIGDSYQKMNALWCTVKEAGVATQMTDAYVPGGGTLFAKPYTLEEKL